MRRALNITILGLLAVIQGPVAVAQPDNPVYVDDSPRAWELFRLARQQAADNEGESVRLYQELLDEYGDRLIPIQEHARDQFATVRTRVLDDLLDQPAVLDRYRLIHEPEAARLLASGDVRSVISTRPLTTSGLDAILFDAQESLESGRFRVALGALDAAVVHPDFAGERAAHALYMTALASLALDRVDDANDALSALDDLPEPGPKFARELRVRRDQLRFPDMTRGATVLDHSHTADLAGIVGQSIWSTSLDDSLVLRQRSQPTPARPINPPPVARSQPTREHMTVAATIAGATVYVNEGYTIRALDRFTGRDVWPKPYVHTRTPFDGENEPVGDMNIVAVEGNTLVSLIGHAYRNKRSGDGTVVCLNAATGEARWSRSLHRLDGVEEYDALFPHGAPVIAEGAMFLLARKVTPQMLTGCYAVSLDLETGATRWIRHIASSGSQNRQVRALSDLTWTDGDLFVSTPVGAVARIDASSGRPAWLRRFPVPLSPRISTDRKPWEMNRPIVRGEHVMTISPDQQRILVLDREHGDVLSSHEADTLDGWNRPHYLLAVNDLIYGIGNEIRAFSVSHLDEPLWMLPDRSAARSNPASPRQAMTLHGRVQVVDEMLLVPVSTGVLAVDSETGQIAHEIALMSSGNPTATQSQLLIASADTLDAYMSLDRAKVMLRERIATSPDNPQPALALLQLGLRAEHLELVLEGAEFAWAMISNASLQAAERQREELFDLLIEAHRRAIARSPEQGESLFAMIEMVAGTSDQRIAHLLAYGDWLSANTPARAIEAWQTICTDRVLAHVLHEQRGVLRPAANWAFDRMNDLLEEHGRVIYAPQADFAAQVLAHVNRNPEPDVEALIDLSRQYPASPTAETAALTAASIRERQGDDRSALAILLAAYHAAPSSKRAAALLGPFIDRVAQSYSRERAQAMLRALSDQHGDLTFQRPDGARTTTEWIAELERQLPPRPELPRIGSPAEPVRAMPGTLLTPMNRDALGIPTNTFLMLNGGELSLYETASLEPRWTIPADADARLLAGRDDLLLLWQGQIPNVDDPRVVAIDLANGEERWTSPRLRDHLQTPVGASRTVDQMPNGEPFRANEILAITGNDAMYFVQRTGGVMCVDASRAGAMNWAVPETLEEVHLAAWHDFGLVLAGSARDWTSTRARQQPVPAIVVLDPATGRRLHRIRPLSATGVTWIRFDAWGTALVGTHDGVEAIDLLTGARRWANQSARAAETTQAWTLGETVLVHRGEEGLGVPSLASLRLHDGTLAGMFETILRDEWMPEALHDVEICAHGIFARYSNRIVRYDVHGGVLGADAINEDRDFRFLLPAADRLVVISLFDSEQPIMNQRRQSQLSYHFFSLSENGRVLDGPTKIILDSTIHDAAVVDDWVLISGQHETSAIPHPAVPHGAESDS